MTKYLYLKPENSGNKWLEHKMKTLSSVRASSATSNATALTKDIFDESSAASQSILKYRKLIHLVAKNFNVFYQGWRIDYEISKLHDDSEYDSGISTRSFSRTSKRPDSTNKSVKTPREASDSRNNKNTSKNTLFDQDLKEIERIYDLKIKRREAVISAQRHNHEIMMAKINNKRGPKSCHNLCKFSLDISINHC